MRFTLLTLTALLAQYASSAPQTPPPADDTDTPGFDATVYSRPEALQAVQFNEYIDHLNAAALQYGIDNLPDLGLGEYPSTLLKYLRIWKKQTDTQIELAETILKKYDTPVVPPCEYTIGEDRIGTNVSDAGVYLLALTGIIQTSISANLALVNNTAGVQPNPAVEGAQAAAVNARKQAYIRTIAGVNPAPEISELVAPNVLTYLFSLYYVKPGSCNFVPPPPAGSPPFPSFRPINILAVDPPLPFAPSSGITAGVTRYTFALKNTVYSASKPGERESPLETEPKFAGYLSDNAPPYFVELDKVERGEEGTNVSFVNPKEVFGFTYVVITEVDTAKTGEELAADTLAGPFIIFPPTPAESEEPASATPASMSPPSDRK
ncbi:MAG: hypothetical protein M1831_004926 [Alyxoria varia]|nr:MAG: hypothetical protein M1831_004926 [Alyxoria varia]